MDSRRSRSRYQWSHARRDTEERGRLHQAEVFGERFQLEQFRLRIDDFDGLAAQTSMEAVLHANGFPTAEEDLTPDEDLIQLLINAAEIEHGLLIQYLYAAASAGSNDLGAYLMTLAIEEMGHFLTVQNLLVAFGATPHLQHSDWVETEFFRPFGFRLEPASKPSIAKYAVAEMPAPESQDIDDQQRAALPSIFQDAAAAGSASDAARRVGVLYMKIYWLLRASDDPLPAGQDEPWTGFPVATAAKECPGLHISDSLLQQQNLSRLGLLANWGAPGRDLKVPKIESRADALQAIADLSAQGEGFGSSADGHFDKLVRAWKLLGDQYPEEGEFAIDPWYEQAGQLGQVRSGDKITNPICIAFAQMGDKAYEIVVLTIALTMLMPGDAPAAARSAVAKASIKCMQACLWPCVGQLAKAPISADPAIPKKQTGLPYLQTPLLEAADVLSVRSRVQVLKDHIVAIAADVQQLQGASIGAKKAAKAVSNALVNDVWPAVQQAPAPQ